MSGHLCTVLLVLDFKKFNELCLIRDFFCRSTPRVPKVCIPTRIHTTFRYEIKIILLACQSPAEPQHSSSTVMAKVCKIMYVWYGNLTYIYCLFVCVSYFPYMNLFSNALVRHNVSQGKGLLLRILEPICNCLNEFFLPKSRNTFGWMVFQIYGWIYVINLDDTFSCYIVVCAFTSILLTPLRSQEEKHFRTYVGMPHYI